MEQKSNIRTPHQHPAAPQRQEGMFPSGTQQGAKPEGHHGGQQQTEPFATGILERKLAGL